MDGVFNIYKEKGFTSHDVVAVVRKTVHMKKVGHGGTLDPAAEGVLPVCLGRATKLTDYIMEGQKTYLAELTLGVTTDTQDATGQVLKQRPVTVSREALETAVAGFIGEIWQVPPMYSARKVNGKKLYDLARNGEEVERQARKIRIFNIEVEEYSCPKAKLLVTCGKGTYIRTLCADLGEALGCGGHMSALTRTAVGRFTLENALTLDQLKTLAEAGRAEEALLGVEEALAGYGKAVVLPKYEKLLQNGAPLDFNRIRAWEGYRSEGSLVAACLSDGTIVGLYRVCERNIKPVRLL